MKSRSYHDRYHVRRSHGRSDPGKREWFRSGRYLCIRVSCTTDGEIFSSILKLDSKFDDVLVLTQTTSSGEVKSQLIEFINKHKAHEVDDLVFYFSGHGDFNENEFFFLLSDFDPKRRKQTTLENSELDNFLRALSPTNTIKIVDACHSGKVYIKDSDVFGRYLDNTKGQFKNCYFLFSSQTGQYSYQDHKLSFFTRSIIESIHNHSTNVIRYKDIIDFVSDQFSNNSEQTPFFIVQADFTEAFCTISRNLREYLQEMLHPSDSEGKNEEKEQRKLSLVELVARDAARYCNAEQAMNYLANFIANISNCQFTGELKDLYSINAKIDREISSVQSASSIGKWLLEKEHKYFAKPIFRVVKREKRVLKTPRSTFLEGIRNKANIYNPLDVLTNDSAYELVEVDEKIVSGFEQQIEMPASQLSIYAEPKFPNISPAVAFIVPIISKTHLRIFYAFVFFDEKGWSDRLITQPIKWITLETELINLKNMTLPNELIKKFSDFLIEPITGKFISANDDSEQDDAT
ncbi:caspase family protein [Aeromonas veronii]